MELSLYTDSVQQLSLDGALDLAALVTVLIRATHRRAATR